jgi:hypothetical protein
LRRAEAFLSARVVGWRGSRKNDKNSHQTIYYWWRGEQAASGRASNRLETSSLCTERHERDFLSASERESAHYFCLLPASWRILFLQHQHTHTHARFLFRACLKSSQMVAASGSPLRTSTIVRQKMLCNFHGIFLTNTHKKL